MRILSVSLKNIRSYESETIEFQDGTTLLSGDIGSGKSTILLAIEFALFGIMRSGLSGTALLRHGKQEGSVNLRMLLANREVEIFRAIKRGKNSVGQDSGYIVTDGEKFEGTPVELKAKVIEMLGYPDDLVSKSKSPLFRFTVYTPQEEMKAILFEGTETRLDTLRRIFNIDKYKRIKENAAMLLRELRSEERLLKGRLEGEKEAKEKLAAREKERSEAEKLLRILEKNILAKRTKLEKASENLREAEKKSESHVKAQAELEVVKSEVKNIRERRDSLKEELEELSSAIKKLESEEFPDQYPEENVKKVESAIKIAEKKLSQLEKELAMFEAKKAQAEELKSKISELDMCPVCRQEVDESHAEKVIGEQDRVLKKISLGTMQRQEIKQKVNSKLEKLKKKMQELREMEKKYAAASEKKKSLEEKKERKRNMMSQLEELDRKENHLLEKSASLKQSLAEGAAENLRNAREECDSLKEEMKELEVSRAKAEQGLKSVEGVIKELENSLSEFAKHRKNLQKARDSLNWLESYFVNVVEIMEKRVMLRIYNEFNEYFIQWFNTLMEDESLMVRLDETFSPVITQDGYETGIDNLSGGERTSVALAYRLSLNKVINDFMGEIQTKEIIILDEPTDGFSSEQLDRVREVLKQLDISQTILVSHEPKMESYVDNIIRISKAGHVSRVC